MGKISVHEAMEAVRSGAKGKPDPVVYGSLAVGDIHWQGDLGILKIESVPADRERMDVPDGQLAEGQTRGSRHVVRQDHMAHVEFFKSDSHSLNGPVMVAKAPTEITHPDHGHVTVPPGVYQIRFQREQTAASFRRLVD